MAIKWGIPMRLRFILWALLGSPFSVALGDCISLVKGPIILDVRTCGVLNPEGTFDPNMERYQFIMQLPPMERKRFYHSYRGMVIRGTVAKSKAIRSGLAKEMGALQGESIAVFVPPGSTAYSCQKIQGKRLAGMLDEACCEGGGDPPCLLQSSLVFKDLKVTGTAAQKAPGSSVAQQRKVSKLEKAGDDFFKKKDFKKAIGYYRAAWGKNLLGIRGLYKLGLAYRFEDKCGLAIKPLEAIRTRFNKKDYWAEDLPLVHKGKFLLARCYAKINKPGFAVTVLDGFLIEPQRFQKEIRASLTHQDFGWIKTSKEYGEYRKRVKEKLGWD